MGTNSSSDSALAVNPARFVTLWPASDVIDSTSQWPTPTRWPQLPTRSASQPWRHRSSIRRAFLFQRCALSPTLARLLEWVMGSAEACDNCFFWESGNSTPTFPIRFIDDEREGFGLLRILWGRSITAVNTISIAFFRIFSKLLAEDFLLFCFDLLDQVKAPFYYEHFSATVFQRISRRERCTKEEVRYWVGN